MSHEGLIAAFWRSFFVRGPEQREQQHQQQHALGGLTLRRSESGESGPKKLNKRAPRASRQNRKSRDAAAAQHFKGAQVVQKPEDAFRQMRASTDRADSAVSGLFDGAFL